MDAAGEAEEKKSLVAHAPDSRDDRREVITDEVIAAFVNVAATEIAAEPAVRSWFREQFLGHPDNVFDRETIFTH